MRIAKTVAAVALVLGLVLIVSPTQSPAVATGGVTIPDHYKVYDMNGDPIISGTVELTDQFGLTLNDFSGPLEFGLPTSKNEGIVYDPTLHYTWYKIFSREPGRSVVYENQFGTGILHTYETNFMLVPALKFPDGVQTLPTANHYKCYRADGEPLALPATLETQFGLETVKIGGPEIFCNPAQKFIPSTGEVFPIVDDVNHLVCYRIDPPDPLDISVSYADQFSPGGGTLSNARWLCIPSKKTGVVQASDKTWGELKAIYR